MLKKFNGKKEEILERLSRGDADYTDASPKGSVDEGVRELVGEINGVPGFVTTSSCAGRVAVFLEGEQKQAVSSQEGYEGGKSEDATRASAGGKGGGGKWLFNSHAPIDLENYSGDEALCNHLGIPSGTQQSNPPLNSRPQFVHFKFEPMILHILTSSSEQAQSALNAAMTAGFRESGITGILDNKLRPSTPMVAVRTSGLSLDSIIGFQSHDNKQITPMVSEAHLRTLVQIANERFRVNEERKARFRRAFLEQVGFTDAIVDSSRRDYTSRHAYEPAAARRERKRREGLARKEKMLAFAGALDGADGANGVGNGDEEDDDYGMDLLMGENDDAASDEPSIDRNQEVDFG